MQCLGGAERPGRLRGALHPGPRGEVAGKGAITVNAVTATIEPPATVKAGTEFTAEWAEAGYAEDFLAMARVGQPPGGSGSRTQVRPGTSLKLCAPKGPGTYESPYVLGRANRLLAKIVITVEAPHRDDAKGPSSVRLYNLV